MPHVINENNKPSTGLRFFIPSNLLKSYFGQDKRIASTLSYLQYSTIYSENQEILRNFFKISQAFLAYFYKFFIKTFEIF